MTTTPKRSRRSKRKISEKDLRAGRWTIHPDILAGGNRLPRLADGKPYIKPDGTTYTPGEDTTSTPTTHGTPPRTS